MLVKKKTDDILHVNPRWLPVAGGLLTSTVCGMLLYAFSVFIKPINSEFGWSRSEIALAFSICCLCNGLTAFFAGKLTDKFGPRYVVLIGGMMTATGFFLSAFIQAPFHLYLTYGVMSGIGSGLIYLPPIVTAPKWWPDRPALATGFVVSGLGLGAFIMGPVATWITINTGWRSVFLLFGIIMGTMCLIASYLLTNPPKNWDLTGIKILKKNRHIESISYSKAIKTKQFLFLYFSYFFAATAGLMVIGHIAAHGKDQGLTSMQAAGAVSAFAIANGLTRVLSGLIVDKIKLKTYFVTLLAIQSLAMILLHPAGSNYLCLWIVAATIGWNFGAMFMLFPTITLTFFGPKEQGSIYGLLFTSYGIAGLVGPWSGGFIRDISGTYLSAFFVSSIIVAITSLLIGLMKPPYKNKQNI